MHLVTAAFLQCFDDRFPLGAFAAAQTSHPSGCTIRFGQVLG